MRVLSRIIALSRNMTRRAAVERELDDELRAAAQTLEERYVAGGMTRASARRAARLALGGVEPVKDAVRDIRAGAQLDILLADIRYGLRTLRKAPAFTAAAVLSLALGIGANAAIFTFINALVLRPLPVRDASSLYEISAVRQDKWALLSFPMYRDIAERQHVMTGIVATAGETPLRVTVPSSAGGATEIDNVRISFVSGNYFSLLGVDAASGRVFTPDDDRDPESAEASGTVVVLSDAFWERQFGRNPSVIGQTILLGRTHARVIGVAPRGFVGEVNGNAADGWVPLTPWSSREDLDNRRGTFTAFFGHLGPGVTEREAQAQLTVLFQQLLAAEGLQPEPQELSIKLESAAAGLDFSLRRTYLQPLLIVMGMVALVLLIACANIANLLLARSASRAGEIGVRLALGCSRSRLVRQLLTESAILSAAGALAGLVVSRWAAHSLANLITRGTTSLRLNIEPDVRVFAFLAVLAILTTLLFGLAPSVRATRVDLAPALKGLQRGSGRASRQRAGRVLVVAQVAMSLLLLVGAGLLTRSFQKLHAQDFGFSTEGVTIFSLGHGPSDRSPAALGAVERAARQRVLAIPGVQSASFSGILLFSPSDISSPFTIPGVTPRPGAVMSARFNSVSPGYFETLRMPLVAGRTFAERDDQLSAPGVAVINERMAREFFSPTPQEAVGRTIVLSGGPARGKRIEIVGVIRDAKYNNLREGTKPMFYMPYAQLTRALRAIEIRSSLPAAALAGPVREALSAVTKDIMIRQALPLSEQVDGSLAAERVLLRLCVLFGALALVLSCVGLYGVIAYSVAQRTPEIGLRVALGATPGSVMRGVLRDMLILVACGIALGVPAALASARLLQSFLYGLTPRDPATITGAIAILGVAAVIAAAIPAVRAARVDPNVALRCE